MKSLLSQITVAKNSKTTQNSIVGKLLIPESIEIVSGGMPKICNYKQTASDPAYDQDCTVD